MNKLIEIISESEIKNYFSDLTDEEIERRAIIFLEIYPFLLRHIDLFQTERSDSRDYLFEIYSSYLKELRDKSTEVEI